MTNGWSQRQYHLNNRFLSLYFVSIFKKGEKNDGKNMIEVYRCHVRGKHRHFLGGSRWYEDARPSHRSSSRSSNTSSRRRQQASEERLEQTLDTRPSPPLPPALTDSRFPPPSPSLRPFSFPFLFIPSPSLSSPTLAPLPPKSSYLPHSTGTILSPPQPLKDLTSHLHLFRRITRAPVPPQPDQPTPSLSHFPSC